MRRTKYIISIVLFIVSIITFYATAKDNEAKKGVRFDPVIKNIEGWKIHIDPALLEGKHAESGDKALKMLSNHLQRIAILVQGKALEKPAYLVKWSRFGNVSKFKWNGSDWNRQ